MNRRSATAVRSRVKYQEKSQEKPRTVSGGSAAKAGKSGNLPDPVITGALLGVLAVASLLLLKDKSTDAGELLVLGRFIRDDLGGEQSFNWTGRSTLIAGLLPGALLWSIWKKDINVTVTPGNPAGKIPAFFLAALSGIAGGALMMSGIQFSGFSVWAALQKAVQLSGGAAVFLGSAAVTAFLLSAAAVFFRRKKR